MTIKTLQKCTLPNLLACVWWSLRIFSSVVKTILIESNSWALIGASCIGCSLEVGGTETLIGCLFFMLPISSELFIEDKLGFILEVCYKIRKII